MKRYQLLGLCALMFLGDVNPLSAQDGEDRGDNNEYDLIDRTWDRADFDPYNYPQNRRRSRRKRGRRYHIDHPRHSPNQGRQNTNR